ncbi:hypothetical protein DTS87_03835 [Salmonella enterica]|nr:hypothetical protein [Salmonella enterica]
MFQIPGRTRENERSYYLHTIKHQHYRSPSLKGCCNTGDRYLNSEHRNQHLLFKTIARSRISCFPDAGATLIFQQNILLT